MIAFMECNHVPPKVMRCLVFDMMEHDTAGCPIILGFKEALHGQANAVGQHRGAFADKKSEGTPYSNIYNPC